MGQRRGTPITIRLVKGAYWDYEVLSARRLGWPEPVYLQKWQSDASFERCSRFLLEHHDRLRPAFGSHNIRSLAHAIAAAGAGLPPSAYELQTLFGMGDLIQRALVDVATAYGSILPTAPCCRAWPTWYVVYSKTPRTNRFSKRVSPSARIDDLLRDPEEIGAMLTRTRRSKTEPTSAAVSAEPPPFRNEPPTDFARADQRETCDGHSRKFAFDWAGAIRS